MTWLMWRQHRTQLAVLLALVAAMAATYAMLRGSADRYVDASGLGACLKLPAEGCGHAIGGLRDLHPGVVDSIVYLTFLPALAGLFVGAPLIAGEFEHGTHRLVWTQALGRGRWVWAKLTTLSVLCGAGGLAVGLLTRWMLLPYIRGGAVSPVAPQYFGLMDLSPAFAAMFAFCLGAAAGAYTRRTLSAMVITVTVFVLVRLVWELNLWRLLSPKRVLYAADAARAPVGRADWRTGSGGYVLPDGHAVSDTQILTWCPVGNGGDKGGLSGCLASHGVRQLDWYEPAGRFWTYQAIDAAFFVLLAAVLMVAAGRRTLRRAG
jgi:hypothetical protein